MPRPPLRPLFFFFTDTATTEIYTLSLHDALPISYRHRSHPVCARWKSGKSGRPTRPRILRACAACPGKRSEEHTSELQSRLHLVCRLLLEKKKNSTTRTFDPPRTCAHLRNQRPRR